MKRIDKNRIIAICATLLLHILIAVILVFSFLYYSWPPKDLPLPKESEILFGGEYVMLGNFQAPSVNNMDNAPSDVSKEVVNNDGDDAVNSGEPGDGRQLVSADFESDMKVKKEKPEKNGPTQEEKAEQERIKREKEAADRINKRVSFNSTGKKGGKEGSLNGNSDFGARNGAPGHSLKGRTLEDWGKPTSNVDGKVVIEVRVDPRGRVISARYKSGTGSAAGSIAVRRSCEQASLKSRFSVSTETTVVQVGTITWKFE